MQKISGESHDQDKPDSLELRKFGLLFAAILLLLFDALLPWLKHRTPPLWPLYIAAPCVLLAIVRPSMLAGFHRAWLRFGAIAAFINTRIIMAVIFFVLLTPLAWWLRLRGRDALARRFEPAMNSYRSVSAAPQSKHMEKPY